MKAPLLQTENRVRRTYRGGRSLEEFLGKESPKDSFFPEDWISSFVQAKNKEYVEGEGISRVLCDGRSVPITEAVKEDDLGPGRRGAGVLIKLLDAGERLGIQVHPTPQFSLEHFSCPYGKTECWHILHAREGAAVYVGFKEGITREEWKRLFEAQDIQGMLERLHRIEVHEGDTVLVHAGSPHAIGEGCFLLEIQEPTDYTMRVEKTTLSGERLTPMQVHYGIGEEALLDCFLYDGLSEEEARRKHLLLPKKGGFGYPETMLVDQSDTPCFALGVIKDGEEIAPDSFVTLVVTKGGTIRTDECVTEVRRGSKLFVPYGCGRISSIGAEALVCYPPRCSNTAETSRN